ncbi:MAG TPA: hypothetical protein H9870_13095 [Candidatus Corynebacterium avicola]|uniref:Uncharacterized protein n=1 Tax=Candidatus Corynebacterium avicola TaxID=2838527 RepID=A0A9D1RRQ6_9CORY|nr:hypothetical protein [Candidatus Corynebacterium avicola]
MKTSRAIALSASVLLVGGIAAGGVVAELNAQSNIQDTVEDVVASVSPDATTSKIDVRGRPLFLSDQDSVSTAYVDVTENGQDAQWIVQDYKEGVVGLLDVFVPVTVEGDSAQPSPVRNPDGSFTDRGTVNGTEVTYGASLTDGVLTVTADGSPVSSINLPGVESAEKVSPYVSEEGLIVNLQARNLAV